MRFEKKCRRFGSTGLPIIAEIPGILNSRRAWMLNAQSFCEWWWCYAGGERAIRIDILSPFWVLLNSLVFISQLWSALQRSKNRVWLKKFAAKWLNGYASRISWMVVGYENWGGIGAGRREENNHSGDGLDRWYQSDWMRFHAVLRPHRRLCMWWAENSNLVRRNWNSEQKAECFQER